MNLNSIFRTLDSQIPIVALEVLAPEELTIIEWLTSQAQQKLETPTYFWNLGVSGLEQCLIALDGGLVFKPVPEYKKPPQADPLIYIFEYINSCSELQTESNKTANKAILKPH